MGAAPLHATMSHHERQSEGAIKVLPAFSIPQSNELVARLLLAHLDWKDLGLQDWRRNTVLHLDLTKEFYSIALSLLHSMTASEHLGLQDCNGITAEVSTETQDCYGRTPL